MDKYKQYEPVRGDGLCVALWGIEKEEVEEKDGVAHITKYITPREKKVNFLSEVYREWNIDLGYLNKRLIMDTHLLKVEDVIQNFDSMCDIYCLGMPDEDPEELYNKIRENDGPFDWTSRLGYFSLSKVCNFIIEKSKELKEDCERFNVNFFDTSGNRKEKLKEVINVIETNSILD